MENRVSLFARALKVFAVLTIITMLFEVFAITANVLLRYIAHSSLTWLDEFGSIALIWLTFASGVLLLEENGHFHFELFVTWLFPKARANARAYLFTYSLIAMCFGLIGYYGIVLCYTVSGSSTLTLPVSKGLVVSIIPVGCFAMMVGAIRKAIRLQASTRRR